MSLDFIFDIPNVLVFLIIITFFLAIAIIGFYIFTILTADSFSKSFIDQNTGTFLGAVAVAIALVIAFVIANEYQTYNETSENLTLEANTIYALIQTLTAIEEIPDAVTFAGAYLCSIPTEFSYMSQGELPPDNTCLNSLQAIILDYDPISVREQVLYSTAIEQLNLAITLRNSRLERTFSSLPAEFWYLILSGFVAIIIIMWFVNGSMLYKFFMISLVTVVFSGLIFLIFILSNVFAGDFSLSYQSFTFVINQLGLDCNNSGTCFDPLAGVEESKLIKNKVKKCCYKVVKNKQKSN
jgi:hypothetical protein